ncbi:MAG: hypothetical protein AAF594_02480 [Bacteroidota bacterium]
MTSPSASVHRLIVLGLSVVVAACGTSRPPAPPPEAEVAPPVMPVPEPEPLPEPPPPPPEPEPPPPPPEAPKGSIEARSLYPQVGLADWTLANGLRVVFKQLDAPSFVVRALDLESDSIVVQGEEAETLGDALAGVRPRLDPRRSASALVVVVGPADPEAAEGWVAARLASLMRGEVSYRLPIPPSPQRRAEVDWDDLRASLVVRSLLESRGASLALGGQSVRVEAASVAEMDRVLRPATDAEARAARDTLEVDAALWAETLAFLYAEPGAFRPARRPEAAARLLDRLGAVPPAAVNALLDRLRDADASTP